jgi:hypothetical protein
MPAAAVALASSLLQALHVTNASSVEVAAVALMAAAPPTALL